MAAFGGGGSATYQAILQINTQQAQAQLKALNASITQTARNASQQTAVASRVAVAGMSRLTKQLTSPGDNPQSFKVQAAGNKLVKVSVDQLTASQIKGLNATDRARAATLLLARGFQDTQRAGKVTSAVIQKLAQDLAAVGRSAPANVRNTGFKQITDDLANYGAEIDRLSNQLASKQSLKPLIEGTVSALKAEANQLKLNAAAYRDQITAMRAFAAQFANVKKITITAPRTGLAGRLGLRSSTTINKGGSHPGGRVSGGGHGGFIQDSDKVRGQLMPERTKAQAKALLGLSSAAQGAMIGMAALQGSVTGVGFGLIFLGYGIVSVAIAFAALTVAMAVSIRFFKKVYSEATKAGAQMEKFGQQMTSYFKDAARAQENLTKSSKFAKTFGIDPEAAKQAVFTLDKMGMATTGYMNAVADAAAGTGKDVTEVTERWMEIQKANASDRKGLMESFAKDFDIAAKNYTSSVELMTAINDRWGGSAAAAANTNIGWINRIKAAWSDFVTQVGSVLVGFFKPILEAGFAFVEAMTAGFTAAKKSGMETGQLQKNMDEFRALVIAFTPYLVKFGYVLGKIVYLALVGTAKLIKVVASALALFWNKIKPVIDAIKNWIIKIKELLSWLIAWAREHRTLVTSIAAVLGGLLAFELGTRLLMKAFDEFLSLINGVSKAIEALGKMLANTNLAKALNIGVDSIKAAINAIDDLIRKIAELSGKIISFGAAGFGDILDGLKKVSDKIDDIINKAKDIKIGGGGSVNGGINLPKIGVIAAEPIAAALAAAIRLAAAHPLVLLAAAAVGTVIAAGVFPKETGQVTHEIVDFAGAAVITLAAAFVRMHLRLADAIIELHVKAINIVYNVLETLFSGLFEALKNLFWGVFNGITELITAIITGDWAKAASAALDIFRAIFITFPSEVFGAFWDAAKQAVTEGIPAMADALWAAIKYIFEPITEIIKEPLQRAWEWFSGWLDQFQLGWVSEAFDKMAGAWRGALDGIVADFKEIFDFEGAKSIKKLVVGAFSGIADALSFMPNPFGKMLGWLDDLLEKSERVKNVVNALLPGNPVGGSSSSSVSGGGSSAVWQPAKVVGIFAAPAGSPPGTFLYNIKPSHYSDQNPSTINVQSSTYPNLANYALGGRVPGRPGTKVPVLADAGEVFLGRPNLAQGSGREARVGGGGAVSVYLDLRDSVMTNDAVKKITDSVADALVGQLTGNRRMSLHRIG